MKGTILSLKKLTKLKKLTNLSDAKRMQSIVLIETYAYETSKDLVSGKE